MFEASDAPGERIDWNEDAGVEIGRWSAADAVNLVPKTTTIQKYNFFLGQSPTYYPSVTMEVDHRPLSGSNDDFCLDAGSDGAEGEPKLCRTNGATINCTPSPAYQDPDCRPSDLQP